MSKPDWMKQAEEKGMLGKQTRVNKEFLLHALGPNSKGVELAAVASGVDMVNFTMIAESYPELISEETFQKVFETLTISWGWLTYHFRPARTSKGWVTACSGSGAGFVDNVCVRERVVYAELKTEKGVLSDEQKLLIERLLACGEEVYVWTPSMWKEIVTVMSPTRTNNCPNIQEPST